MVLFQDEPSTLVSMGLLQIAFCNIADHFYVFPFPWILLEESGIDTSLSFFPNPSLCFSNFFLF